MTLELLIVPPEDRPGVGLSEIAETLRGFPEIQRVSDFSWEVRVKKGSILRLRADRGDAASRDDLSPAIESLKIETPTPVKVADARVLFPLAFAIASRLD